MHLKCMKCIWAKIRSSNLSRVEILEGRNINPDWLINLMNNWLTSFVLFSTAASIDHRTSTALDFTHTSPASSTHDSNARSTESSSAEDSAESSESEASAESTEDESVTRDEIAAAAATQTRSSPTESNPCGGARRLSINPPSSLPVHRTTNVLTRTHLRNELLPLKHLAEHLFVRIFF